MTPGSHSLQSCLAPKFYQQAASGPDHILFHERQQQKITESVMTGKKMREKLSDPSRISLDEGEHIAASKSKTNFAVCWICVVSWGKKRCAVSEPHKTRRSRETSRNNSPPPARLSRLTQGRDHEEESHLLLSLLIPYNMDGDDDQGTWN